MASQTPSRKTAAPALSLLFLVACLICGALCLELLRTGPTAHAAPAAERAHTPPSDRPADFVENRGQWDDSVKFTARAGESAAAFEREAIRLSFGKERPTVLSLAFEGASPRVLLAGEARRAGRYNFFVGDKPARWRSNVAAYGSVL